MRNRLTQYFASIAPPPALPDIPQPEPKRGYDHFAVGVFDPQKHRKTWTARHAEDAPTTGLEFEDIEWRGRFNPNAIAEALRWVKAFNTPRFVNRETIDEWGLLCWCDGAYEAIKIDFARSVSPLSYFTHELLTPPRWAGNTNIETTSALLTGRVERPFAGRGLLLSPCCWISSSRRSMSRCSMPGL